MFWFHAELQTHHDRLEEFKRICSNTFDHLAQHGMHLYGAWETVIGPRHLVVDMWRFESEQAMLQAFALLQEVPQWHEFARDVPSTIVTEDVRSVNPSLTFDTCMAMDSVLADITFLRPRAAYIVERSLQVFLLCILAVPPASHILCQDESSCARRNP